MNSVTVPPLRGALVVLEGLDRSGKTTQVQLLKERLLQCGHDVELLRFPDRSTPIGQIIDGYLKSNVDMDDHVAHLLFSANRWEAAKNIESLLKRGITVVCDRYYYSGIVYSAAKCRADLSLSWARAPEVGLPRPDLVLFLDLDEEQAMARGGWGDELYEKAEMQRRVRNLFWGLSFGRIDANGSTGPKEHCKSPVPIGSMSSGPVAELRFRQEEEDLLVVDAAQSVQEVAAAIWKVAEPRITAVGRGEVGRTVRHVS